MKSILPAAMSLVITSSFGQLSSTVKISNGVFVTAVTEVFDTSAHHILICTEEGGYEYTCLIDGEPCYGVGQEPVIPRNSIEELKISIGDTYLYLDVSNMYNVSYEGLIYEDQFKFIARDGFYYLYAYFADGAIGYSVQWKIKNNIAIRTYISSDMGESFFEIE